MDSAAGSVHMVQESVDYVSDNVTIHLPYIHFLCLNPLYYIMIACCRH